MINSEFETHEPFQKMLDRDVTQRVATTRYQPTEPRIKRSMFCSEQDKKSDFARLT